MYNKIEFIKIVRSQLGWGLLQSKKLADALYNNPETNFGTTSLIPDNDLLMVVMNMNNAGVSKDTDSTISNFTFDPIGRTVIVDRITTRVHKTIIRSGNVQLKQKRFRGPNKS